MTRLFLALIACLFLAPSLAAQTAANPDTVFESYSANYDVNADGTYTVTTKFLLRLNSKVAIEQNNPWQLPYNSELHSAEVLEAYTLKPNGKRVLVPASSIKNELSAEAQAAPEFSSLKIQTVTFPDVKAGDSVFLVARLITKKPYFEGYFDLLAVFSVNSLWNDVQIDVSAPLNFPLNWDAVDMQGGRLTDRDGRAHWQWKTQVKQTLEAEIAATSIIDNSPRLVASNFPDYAALGAAYWTEAGKKVAVTPAIQQLADEITKGTSEPQQHARAIYDWVNKNIRYLAIMIGRGVFIPHDVSSILQNRYGDCKDYVTILHSLLAAKGIESVPVLIRADDSFWLPKTATIVFFNHVILYLPSLDVYVDATNPNTAFGLLPQALVGKSGVLSGRKTGETFVPKGKPDENQIRSEVNLTISDDGGIKAATSTVFQGRIEMVFRPIFADMKLEDSSTVLNRFLEVYGHKGTGKYVEISNSHRTGESFGFKAEFDLVDEVKIPGPEAMTVPQGLDITSFSDLGRLVALEQRKTSIFAGAFHISQLFRLTFPNGLNVNSVPSGVTFENAAGHYKSTYKNETGVVTVTRELVLDQDVYTTKEYPALRELITKGVEDSKTQIHYSPSKDYKPSNTVAVKSPAKQSTKNIDTVAVLLSLDLINKAAKLSPKKVVVLESMLLKNPDDIETRLLLINYYDRMPTSRAVLQALVRHRKWLIDKYPEREIQLVFNPYAPITQPGPEYEVLKKAWLQQVELRKNDPAVILNAADFLVKRDPQIAESLLQKGQQLEPENYKWAEELGKLYETRAREKVGDEKASAFALSIEQLEKALALNKKERSYQRDSDRSWLLRRLVDVTFDAEQMAKAKQYATELLLEFGRDVTRYSHAEIAHDENVMLGRIALKEGDIAKAKEHLMVAGRTAVLAAKENRAFFTPRMGLAKDLLEKNEKQIVLEYLDLFDGSTFEESKTLKKWAEMIRKGDIPSFDYYSK